MAETNVGTAHETTRVAALCGSLREGSYTAAALRIALDGARSHGAATTFLDLRDYAFGLHPGDLEQAGRGEAVLRLRANVKAQDGLILGTPEYHGSFSGAIKNALDFLTFDEMEGKMIGLVGVSGGVLGAFDAMNGLRAVGRALHAWVVPQQVAIAEAWKVFDGSGGIRNAALGERLAEVGREVARFAGYHKCGRFHEFLRDWEKAPSNPGGGPG